MMCLSASLKLGHLGLKKRRGGMFFIYGDLPMLTLYSVLHITIMFAWKFLVCIQFCEHKLITLAPFCTKPSNLWYLSFSLDSISRPERKVFAAAKWFVKGEYHVGRSDLRSANVSSLTHG